MTLSPALLERAASLPSLQLPAESVGELTLLAQGAFRPVDRYLNERECRLVERELRLPQGQFFPYPITLSSDQSVDPGSEVTLRDGQNVRLAILYVEDCWRDEGTYRLGGSFRLLQMPPRRDFVAERLGPGELPPDRYAALPTGGVLTMQQEETAASFARARGLALLIQVLETSRGSAHLDHFARMRATHLIAGQLPPEVRARVNLLPFREPPRDLRGLLTQALVQKNFGASVLLADPAGIDRRNLEAGLSEIGIELAELPPAAGGRYRPEVRDLIEEAVPPLHRQGYCVWFTGLPSSGKSTIAEALHILLREHGRRCTLLDGDVVRTHLSKGLAFTREDRDTNILRIAYVAGEIVRHHGAVITAAVSPYEGTRRRARRMIGDGHFVLVYVDTPRHVCEERDVKGFYARARSGAIQGFTGVDDPYEPPAEPDLVVQTTGTTPEANARRVLEWLEGRGFVRRDG
jgi:sulfate adenylyltransferase